MLLFSTEVKTKKEKGRNVLKKLNRKYKQGWQTLFLKWIF